MKNEIKIESELQAAQKNPEAADRLIEKYLPFIRSETAKFLKSFPADGQDELSIAMFAFYECILSYQSGRGAFLHLASAAIRNRLIDYSRKEGRHQNQVSLDAPCSPEDPRTLGDCLAAADSRLEVLPQQMATRSELAQFSDQLQSFGLTLSDVAGNCPRQARTMDACMTVLAYARRHPELLDKLVQTRKLPLSQLVKGSGVERKSIERHRAYTVAILLAYTNGYEIIRGHLCKIGTKGGASQ